MNLITVIIITFILLIVPLLSYYWYYENKLQSKFSYKPIILFLSGIFVVLFIPLIFWKNIFESVISKFFENYKDYSEFVISLFAVHSIIQYFFSESNFKNILKTQPGKEKLFNNKDSCGLKYIDFKIISCNGNTNCKYFLNQKEQKLEVCDVLGSGTGDNLWFPINEWFSRNQLEKGYKKMPLWNYVSEKEEDQKEWLQQLNDFIEYLKVTDQICVNGGNNND